MHILLVRHGETAWNREGRYQGRTDMPLSADGERQVRALGARLVDIPIAVAIASPLSRARVIPGRSRGLDAELFDEHRTQSAEDAGRLGQPAAAVEREHELTVELLAQRLLGDQRAELADQLGVSAEMQIGLDPAVQRLPAVLLELAYPRMAFESRHVGERAAAPEGERRAEVVGGCLPVLGCQGTVSGGAVGREDLRVELTGFDPDLIAGADRHEARSVAAQHLAHAVDVVVERCPGRGRLFAAPQQVGDLVEGDDGVRVQQEGGEDRTALRAGQRDRLIPVEDPDLPQQPETHDRPPVVAHRRSGNTEYRCYFADGTSIDGGPGVRRASWSARRAWRV